LASLALYLKDIYQSRCAGQPVAETPAGRKSVAHGSLYVFNAGAFVFKDESQAGTPVHFKSRLRYELAAAAILDDVARQFGCDRGEPRLVYQSKPKRGGDDAHLRARVRDVALRPKSD
jgi:hypothetical protein